MHKDINLPMTPLEDVADALYKAIAASDDEPARDDDAEAALKATVDTLAAFVQDLWGSGAQGVGVALDGTEYLGSKSNLAVEGTVSITVQPGRRLGPMDRETVVINFNVLPLERSEPIPPPDVDAELEDARQFRDKHLAEMQRRGF